MSQPLFYNVWVWIMPLFASVVLVLGTAQGYLHYLFACYTFVILVTPFLFISATMFACRWQLPIKANWILFLNGYWLMFLVGGSLLVIVGSPLPVRLIDFWTLALRLTVVVLFVLTNLRLLRVLTTEFYARKEKF